VVIHSNKGSNLLCLVSSFVYLDSRLTTTDNHRLATQEELITEDIFEAILSPLVEAKAVGDLKEVVFKWRPSFSNFLVILTGVHVGHGQGNDDGDANATVIAWLDLPVRNWIFKYQR
jgi:hypothetical protein